MKKVTRVPSLPVRSADSHKGTFGHVLIVGGSLGMSGSVAMAGQAAGRSGAGLVTIACPETSQHIVAGFSPEPMTLPLPETPDGRIDPVESRDVLSRHHERWTTLAAGPGWGVGDDRFAHDSLAMIETLAGQIARPLVIDAGGLTVLAQTGRLRRSPWPGLTITPHPGELAALLATTVKDVQADRLGAAQQALTTLKGPLLVLKGAGTIVTDGSRYFVNRTGNAGMATGGCGDVLTGVLAALLAQDMEPFDAAVLAVHVHGLAGDLAARNLGEISLIAGDLLACLPKAFRRLTKSRLK